MPLTERPDGRRIYWETRGEEDAEPIALVMGLGLQVPSWPELFYNNFASAGFRVIIIENRDSGFSALETEKATGKKPEELPNYDLSDMADDVAAVLDDAGAQNAVIFGASLGGMIAQLFCLKYPAYARAAAFYMTSSGAPGLPAGDNDALAAILSAPEEPGLEAAIAHEIRIRRATGSTALWAPPDKEIAGLAEGCYRRDPSRTAGPMHTKALFKQAGAPWFEALPALASLPSVVIHGEVDKVFPNACAIDLAERTNSRLWLVPFLGHELSEAVAPLIVAAVVDCVHNFSHVRGPSNGESA